MLLLLRIERLAQRPLLDLGPLQEMVFNQARNHRRVDVAVGAARLAGWLDVHQRLSGAHADAAHGNDVGVNPSPAQFLPDGVHRLPGPGSDATGAHPHDDPGFGLGSALQIASGLFTEPLQIVDGL